MCQKGRAAFFPDDGREGFFLVLLRPPEALGAEKTGFVGQRCMECIEPPCHSDVSEQGEQGRLP